MGTTVLLSGTRLYALKQLTFTEMLNFFHVEERDQIVHVVSVSNHNTPALGPDKKGAQSLAQRGKICQTLLPRLCKSFRRAHRRRRR